MAKVIGSSGVTIELTGKEVEDLKKILRIQLDDGPFEYDTSARDIFDALDGAY